MNEYKKSTDLCIYTTITDLGEEKYKLSAGINIKPHNNGEVAEEEYYLPSLEIKGVDTWDCEEYLYETLYNCLFEKIINNYNDENFEDIIKSIPLKDFPIVFDLLISGMDMGFFEQYRRNKMNGQKQ